MHLLREKRDKFNRIRLQAAQMLMSVDEANIFQILPLLFHLNLNGFPGYIKGNVPSGICQFSINEKNRSHAHSFLGVSIPPEKIKISPEIIGLYAMGSTSSIGQSSESDVDIWICYSPNIATDRIQLLNKKSWKVSQWAENLGVELNFFLVPDNKFRLQNISGLTSNDCGSSQHMLLLDEFYRTALRVAGKRILWYHIPIEHEKNYDAYIKDAYAKKIIIKNDWLDLGGLNHIPAEEYFGATLWQLYKGIDTPYKSLLKAILMEAYSKEYPNVQLISTCYKENFQAATDYNEQHDPYCLILEKVCSYLKSIRDVERLNLVCIAFYFKTKMKLSKPIEYKQALWRGDILDQYLTQWQWSPTELIRLDDRENWKVREVRRAKKRLLNAFMTSYRSLLHFARENRIANSISAEDIGILSRKIYAAYEDLPDKIEFINLKISSNMYEPNLSLIQAPKSKNTKAGWYLYNSTLDKFTLANTPNILSAPYISKILAWSYLNGLYEEETKLHIYNHGSDITHSKLNLFMKNIYDVFPMYTPKTTNQALIKPCEIKQLTIFLNFEKDPTLFCSPAQRTHEKAVVNVFSYGVNQECLIGSIDLLYRNSWNEVYTLHFNKNYSVVDTLNTILGKMHQDAIHPEQLHVFNYSSKFNEEIKLAYKATLLKYINIRLNSKDEKKVQIMRVAGEKFAFHFSRSGVSLQHLKNNTDMYTHITENKLLASKYSVTDAYYEKTPEIITSNVSEGIIQFFFENFPGGFNVYVVNEKNEIIAFHELTVSKDELVQKVNRFYASKDSEKMQAMSPANFNLPQFYDITLVVGEEMKMTTFKSSHAIATESLINN